MSLLHILSWLLEDSGQPVVKKDAEAIHFSGQLLPALGICVDFPNSQQEIRGQPV